MSGRERAVSARASTRIGCREVAERTGLTDRTAVSGAGHEARRLAERIPAGTLLVPYRNVVSCSPGGHRVPHLAGVFAFVLEDLENAQRAKEVT